MKTLNSQSVYHYHVNMNETDSPTDIILNDGMVIRVWSDDEYSSVIKVDISEVLMWKYPTTKSQSIFHVTENLNHANEYGVPTEVILNDGTVVQIFFDDDYVSIIKIELAHVNIINPEKEIEPETMREFMERE